MFDLNDSIYLLTKKKNSYKVYLLSCDREVQNMFALIFNKPLKPGLENGYDEITFQVGYQLSNDEIWKIENFCLPDESSFFSSFWAFLRQNSAKSWKIS